MTDTHHQNPSLQDEPIQTAPKQTSPQETVQNIQRILQASAPKPMPSHGVVNIPPDHKLYTDRRLEPQVPQEVHSASEQASLEEPDTPQTTEQTTETPTPRVDTPAPDERVTTPPKVTKPSLSLADMDKAHRDAREQSDIVDEEFAPDEPAAEETEKTLTYSDDNVQAQEAVDAFDAVAKEAETLMERGIDPINLDKMGLAIPLSKQENTEELQRRLLVENRGPKLEKALADVTSEVRVATNALRYYTANIELLKEGIERLGTPEEKLKSKARSLCDSYASVFKKFENEKHVTLSGNEGRVVMNSLIGGIRRIRLYNSGISVNLRSLSLTALNNYYREVNTSDFEYGKMFGAFYYMYSDLSITKYVIENLLPILICGSNYRHWKDTDKLLQTLTFQDFQTILWAASTMMHPEGVTVNFTCGEPGCGHITKELVDLSKLRLINTELINDDMYAIMSKNGLVSDDDIQQFHEKSGLKKSLKFEYRIGDSVRKWTIHLKQANLYDYVKVGDDYMHYLQETVGITSSAEVQSYTQYNYYHVFKPWIESVDLTIFNPLSNTEQMYSWTNDSEDPKEDPIMDMLDNFQIYLPSEFGEKMKQYILDTKISHICFYFPRCPKCGKVPQMSYNGFIPYDVMNSFFTLVLMKLLQVSSTRDTQNT